MSNWHECIPISEDKRNVLFQYISRVDSAVGELNTYLEEYVYEHLSDEQCDVIDRLITGVSLALNDLEEEI